MTYHVWAENEHGTDIRWEPEHPEDLIEHLGFTCEDPNCESCSPVIEYCLENNEAGFISGSVEHSDSLLGSKPASLFLATAPIPCFNCNNTEDTDPETGLCKYPCKPLTSLSTCKGNICPVLWMPEEFEEF